MYAKVQLLGRLGSDPEMRFTENGNPVTSFRMATDERYTKDGEKRVNTTWWKITTWNKRAEVCNQYLSKGQLVFVTGTPKLSEWMANDGAVRFSLEVNDDVVQFCEKKKQETRETIDVEGIPF